MEERNLSSWREFKKELAYKVPAQESGLLSFL
jgi:hypothetical protein